MRRAAQWGAWTVGLAALLAFGIPASANRMRLAYNPTASAPLGWYWIEEAHALRVGDYVLSWIPGGASQLAAARGYLPVAVPILKRVGAVGPQVVCGRGREVFIDGHRVARGLRGDWRGRPLAVWSQCRALADDELFLLSVTNAGSFDSRYFGPITRREVIGRALPIWTW